MIDMNYCMSSYLAFRYIVDDNRDFCDGIKHQIYKLIPENKRILVWNENDIDKAIEQQLNKLSGKKMGLLLSGGMDSACLASYLKGADAYTFRFRGGEYQREELKRAEYYAQKYELTLHYVDIDWDIVQDNIVSLMKQKGAPTHSIEPQILEAAKQAKKDGVEVMVIGDAADYVFAGMDGLYAKDWTFDEFVERYMYLKPEEILVSPVSMIHEFRKFKKDNMIDYIGFMHVYTDIESYASYENAFNTSNISYIDPYEVLKMAEPFDLQRIRSGESKYLIRRLFKTKYPELEIPSKLPMPRLVDEYFANWDGPKRPEFRKDIDIKKYTGNQKWLIWCLERFLDIFLSSEK